VADINRFLTGSKSSGRSARTASGATSSPCSASPRSRATSTRPQDGRRVERVVQGAGNRNRDLHARGDGEDPPGRPRTHPAAHRHRCLRRHPVGGNPRLDWEDIKWDRGHIEIAGKKAKTAARRLVPLTDNLKAWLAPWREETGPIITISDYVGALNDTAVKAQIPGGWRQNALRHSFISYRVAETGDVARTSLEAGNSPKMIFRHYREVVDEAPDVLESI
jgi:hypothetical protein